MTDEIYAGVKPSPVPSLADLQAAHERFREVMTDTLERATQFLRDRASDGVTDEDDDALLRECETVLEWARACCAASGRICPMCQCDEYKHAIGCAAVRFGRLVDGRGPPLDANTMPQGGLDHG